MDGERRNRGMSSNSILRLKSESPKFRDVLRQKCQRRWQENRWRALDKRRCIAEEPEESLADIIKEDLKSVYLSRGDVERHLEDFEQIQSEILDDEFKWYMDECTKILDDDEQLAVMLDDLSHVVCPICQKHPLRVESENFTHFLVCVCGVKLKTSLELPRVKDTITNCVNVHNNHCAANPSFSLINEIEEAHIYLLCYTCSSFVMML